ncbi:F0F1 ATP synthase subunit A [Pseudorhodoferax sp.]|uniref:F0F1 ATP synthase subunit A n=1 Tax=Pseudorhodoferax sp. TaxID=1993553 RepID=UPI002DD6914F|nr:F0F1 ATP synthase subunit A [Pseudorhodoferax sp.]
MAAETGNAPTAGEYIIHHLHHLQAGSGFWTINLDSLFYSIVLGVLGCWFLRGVAKRMSSGVPGRTQAAVEFLVEMVDSQAKAIVHNAESRKMVAPLALTVFIWIFLMNAMDLLPVDLLPTIWHSAGPAVGMKDYMRVVPTADLSITMALSVTVLLICIYYNIKIKGAGGWLHELLSAPFGAKWYLAPFNLGMQLIEFVAKTVSHGMRLFGNMYAGELIFMLIALMGGAWFTAVGIPLAIGHIIAGTAWAIFHILIITLQAFVFMMLTLVYVGQAHDAH